MSDAIDHPYAEPPAEGCATEIAPGLLWMRLPLPWGLDHVNVYVLEGPGGWTLVDTGIDSRRTRAIWETLLAGPLRGKPVERLIVTHHHPDHVGLAGWFQARGAELCMTRTAWIMARMLVLDVQETPSPQAMILWQRAGLPPEALARRAGERPYNSADVVHAMPPGFSRITEGQRLHLAGRDWLVRIGHGHAPCHATLWTVDDGRPLVLGGDQLLPGISANIGVYPTEPEADPLADWLESCARLAMHATQDQLVLPGHKLPFTGLPFRLRQMAENHQTALTRLLEHLAVPRRAVDCFPVLFKRRIGPAEEGLALAESLAHLNHLHRRGLAGRSLAPDGAFLWQRS